MNHRKVFLLFFLVALAAISVASVALGGTDGVPSGNLSADPIPAYVAVWCDTVDGGPGFWVKAQFWWTIDGKKASPATTVKCKGSQGYVFELVTVPDGANDVHVKVWVKGKGFSTHICEFKSEFAADSLNYWNGGYCNLPFPSVQDGWYEYGPQSLLVSLPAGGPAARLSANISTIDNAYFGVWCDIVSGGPGFSVTGTFWWTIKNKKVGDPVIVQCTADQGWVGVWAPAPDDVTDVHVQVQVQDTDSGQNNYCEFGQKFKKKGKLPWWNGGYCNLPNGMEGWYEYGIVVG